MWAVSDAANWGSYMSECVLKAQLSLLSLAGRSLSCVDCPVHIVSTTIFGPTVWNKLSLDLRSTDSREQFKHKLKGWLFECAYGRRCV